MEGLEGGPDPSDYQLNLDYWHQIHCPPGQKPVITHVANAAQGPGIIHWTCYTCAHKINPETGRYSIEVCPLCRDKDVKIERRNTTPVFSVNPPSPAPAQNSNIPPLPPQSGWSWWPTNTNNSAIQNTQDEERVYHGWWESVRQSFARHTQPTRTNNSAIQNAQDEEREYQGWSEAVRQSDQERRRSAETAERFARHAQPTHTNNSAPWPQHLPVELVADPYPTHVVMPEPEPPVVPLVRYESVQSTDAIQNAQDEEREYQRGWEAVRQSDRERRRSEQQAQEAAEAAREAAERFARETHERHRIERREHAQEVTQARLDRFHTEARQKRTIENRHRGVFYREQELQIHRREAEETAEQLRKQHMEEERMQRNRIVF